MAVTPSHHSPQTHKLPLHTYVDALRWLPHVSTFTRHILFAAYDSDTFAPSLHTHTLSPSHSPSLTPQASLSVPSRITSLKVAPSPFSPAKPLIAAATYSGSVLFCSADLINGTLNLEFTLPEQGFHLGPVAGIDLSDSGSECVSVGEDGCVNLVNVAAAKKGFRRVFESNGLVSYSSVRWASPVEFATGAFGFGLHWWDQRNPGGPVALFKENWTRGITSGIVHSIDIHPSRKHTCLAGGSSGTLFAWDIRWPKQSVILSGVDVRDAPANSLVESDIWEVQYDNYTHSSKIINSSSSSSKVLPAMICSEDGILGVVNQGEPPVELLAEPCAINGFDIDRQNPSDIICSLEWESIAILTRQ